MASAPLHSELEAADQNLEVFAASPAARNLFVVASSIAVAIEQAETDIGTRVAAAMIDAGIVDLVTVKMSKTTVGFAAAAAAAAELHSFA